MSPGSTSRHQPTTCTCCTESTAFLFTGSPVLLIGIHQVEPRGLFPPQWKRRIKRTTLDSSHNKVGSDQPIYSTCEGVFLAVRCLRFRREDLRRKVCGKRRLLWWEGRVASIPCGCRKHLVRGLPFLLWEYMASKAPVCPVSGLWSLMPIFWS